MEEYQVRLKDEYTELRAKYIKLCTFISNQDQKKTNEVCRSLHLLKQQRIYMNRYLDILERRCIMEGIEL